MCVYSFNHIDPTEGTETRIRRRCRRWWVGFNHIDPTEGTETVNGEPDKTQSELPPKYKTAIFLQQLIFPQHAHLVRLSNKH